MSDEGSFNEGHSGGMSEGSGFVSNSKTRIQATCRLVDNAQDRGLSEIEIVADEYNENIHNRTRDMFAGKEPWDHRRNKNRAPIEDETSTGQPHFRLGSERPSKRSPKPSDDDQSNDGRCTSAKSVRSSRTRSFDETRPRRERVRDVDSPFPLRRRSTRALSGDYTRIPYRNSFQPLPYGCFPPPPHHPRNTISSSRPRGSSRYRSRTITPRGRRGTRSSDSDFKSKREKIKNTIKPFAAGGAGAIAGALIGHAAGEGNIATTLVGAAIGAIGGDEAEEYWEKRKEKKEKRKEKY